MTWAFSCGCPFGSHSLSLVRGRRTVLDSRLRLLGAPPGSRKSGVPTVKATRYFSERRSVKIRYYQETDSLYIEFKPAPGTETREVVGGVNVDLDAAGEVVGFDIDHASKRLDLSTLDESLPRELTRLSNRLQKHLGKLVPSANEPLPEDPAPPPLSDEKEREFRTMSAVRSAVDTARRLTLRGEWERTTSARPPPAPPSGRKVPTRTLSAILIVGALFLGFGWGRSADRDAATTSTSPTTAPTTLAPSRTTTTVSPVQTAEMYLRAALNDDIAALRALATSYEAMYRALNSTDQAALLAWRISDDEYITEAARGTLDELDIATWRLSLEMRQQLSDHLDPGDWNAINRYLSLVPSSPTDFDRFLDAMGVELTLTEINVLLEALS